MTVESFVITALLGLSVWATLGTGRLSLASPGFMALGTFVTIQTYAHSHSPFIAGAAAVASSLAAGAIVGRFAGGLPAAPHAIATLAFSLLVPAVLTGMAAAHALAPHALSTPWALICLAAAVAALWYARGRWAFAAGAAVAGLAGALHAHAYAGSVSDSLAIERLGVMVAVAVIGGTGSPIAPIFGASLLALLLRAAAPLTDQPLIVDGTALLLALVYLPNGVWPYFETALRAFAPRTKEAADGAS